MFLRSSVRPLLRSSTRTLFNPPKFNTLLPASIHPNYRWAAEQLRLYELFHSLKVIHWDIGGTLADPYCITPLLALQNAFLSIGVKLTTEQITAYMGLNKFQHVVALLGIKEIAEQCKQYNAKDIYDRVEKELDKTIPHFTALTPYAEAALNFLEENNTPFTLTSGYPLPQAKKAATKILERYKPAAITAGGNSRSEMIMENNKILGLPDGEMKNAVFVSDAEKDFKSIADAGNHLWKVGVSKYSTHMNLTPEKLQSCSPADLLQRQQDTKEMLQDVTHLVIGDLSEFPLAMVAITDALACGLAPSQTRRLELIYPPHTDEPLPKVQLRR